ncbi:MAG: GvpL/GvpF family gas vesicle protein [Planctomycetota bacterium]
MRHLVYCILRDYAPWRGRLPAGVGGAAVSLVTDDELAVAVSRVSDAGGAPDVAHAMAYADVIAALSADRTVLPVRYGCLFPARTQVHEFLRARHAEFAALLDELDGCVEMGVRVLLSGAGRPVRERRSRTTEVASGTAYLTGRSAAYARRDAEREAGAATAAAIQRTFNRLSKRSRAAPAVIGENLLVSMYFLIRREHIGAFCRRFRRLQEQGAYRLLLSGPWAPYNFVAAQEPGVV